MSHTYQLQIVNYLVTHWDKFFRYENRGTRPMNVTVEVTYGVTVSEEIENTFENKISVESSVKKSYIEVAQTRGDQEASRALLLCSLGGREASEAIFSTAPLAPGAREAIYPNCFACSPKNDIVENCFACSQLTLTQCLRWYPTEISYIIVHCIWHLIWRI